MDLAHAIAAGGLAARRAGQRFRTDQAEVVAAERRARARRSARAAASARHEFTERGRHAAPRPASA